jgi:hypothetical protein
MPLWTTTDNAAGVPLYANNQLNAVGASSGLYGNTTVSAFVANNAVGVFGVSDTEMNSANNVSEASKVAHSGWALRTTGTGGRAGRTHYETLVAGGISGDGADDAVLPE